MFNTDPIHMRRVSGPTLYYVEATMTTLYAATTFGTNALSVTVTNDSTTDTVQLSWDGATLIADVQPGETLEMATRTRSSIYAKGTAGGGKIRIWAT